MTPSEPRARFAFGGGQRDAMANVQRRASDAATLARRRLRAVRAAAIARALGIDARIDVRECERATRDRDRRRSRRPHHARVRRSRRHPSGGMTAGVALDDPALAVAAIRRDIDFAHARIEARDHAASIRAPAHAAPRSPRASRPRRAESGAEREALRDAATDAHAGERAGPAPNAMASRSASRSRLGQHTSISGSRRSECAWPASSLALDPAAAVARGDAAAIRVEVSSASNRMRRILPDACRPESDSRASRRTTGRAGPTHPSTPSARRRRHRIARPGGPRHRAHRRQGDVRRGRAARRAASMP